MLIGLLIYIMFTKRYRLRQQLLSTYVHKSYSAQQGFQSNFFTRQRPCSTTFPNNEKRDENMMCSGVFVMNFEVFENLVNHVLQCWIYLLDQN